MYIYTNTLYTFESHRYITRSIKGLKIHVLTLCLWLLSTALLYI